MRIKPLFVLSIFFVVIVSPNSIAAVPSVPSGVTARVGTTAAYGEGTVTVSWTKVTGATAYAARLIKSSDNSEIILSVTGETNNEVVFNSLLGGSTYTVQVRAFQVTDVSAWSANTLTAVPKTAPRAPNKPTAIAGIGKATVSWSAVAAADNGGLDVTSYVVKEINSAVSNTAAANATSYELIGLTAGASAEFTVTAINSANTSGTTSVKSDAVTIPSAPTVMSAPSIAGTGTAGEARVSWLPPSSNGGSTLISFTVKLIKDGADLISRVVTEITDTFSAFTSLATGTYTAKIASTNGVGISPFSTESSGLNVTAAPIATVAPSTSPTPTPSASATSGGSSGGGVGGGGVGGGGFGGGGGSTETTTASASPSASSSPTATATATPTASPKPSVTATPLPSPSPTPIITPSPSAIARPGVSTNTKGEVTKTETFAIPTKIVGAVKTTTVSGTKATISTSLKSAVQPSIPSVKKGTEIKVVVKGADGKSYTVASTTAKSTGTYKAPAIQFSKPGTYQVTVMVGKVKKVITYKINK
jgi:uncharacterized membrane protein YgcG